MDIFIRSQREQGTFIFSVDFRPVYILFLDLPGENGTVIPHFRITNGYLVFLSGSAVPEIVPRLINACGVNFSRYLSVCSFFSGNRRSHIQLNALSACHHHIYGVGIIYFLRGHIIPDHSYGIIVSAFFNTGLTVHIPAGISQIDCNSRIFTGINPVTVRILKGYLYLASHIKPAVAVHTACIGNQ